MSPEEEKIAELVKQLNEKEVIISRIERRFDFRLSDEYPCVNEGKILSRQRVSDSSETVRFRNCITDFTLRCQAQAALIKDLKEDLRNALEDRANLQAQAIGSQKGGDS